MSTSVSLFYLRETKHLLAALTRNAAASGDIDEAEIGKIIPNGIVLRYMEQSDLEPGNEPDPKPKNRAKAEFRIGLRHIVVAGTDFKNIDEAAYLLRPWKFSVVDGKAEKSPAAPDGYKTLEIGLLENGVKVTLTAKDGKSINREFPIWCSLDRGPEQDAQVATATIRKNSDGGASESVNLAFPFVQKGIDYNLLIMIKGFQPIWDRLKASDSRTWTIPDSS